MASYRSDELHRRHPLRPLLAEVVRDRYARIVELPLLEAGEMAEQLEDILGPGPDPALTERLYARSDGNPLFAEELLAAGLDGRGTLPPTLRDALMLRVEGLSEPAQKLLRWLAVQPADDVLLAELTGIGSAELRDALREAGSSHIVVTTADDTFAFRRSTSSRALCVSRPRFSSSAATDGCRPSSSAAGVRTRPPGWWSTRPSTGSSSAPRTCRESPPSRQPACASKRMPLCVRATIATARPSGTPANAARR